MLIAASLIISGMILVESAAYAAKGIGERPAGIPNLAEMKVEQSVGNTLQMACSQARAEVKGHEGVVLRTGMNHFDRYHRGGGACDRREQESQPAMVRTKDNARCFIGYTCDDQVD